MAKPTSAIEIIDFYITKKHWLFVEKNRMLDILSKIRVNTPNGMLYKIDYAVVEIKKSTPERINQLRKMYFEKNKPKE